MGSGAVCQDLPLSMGFLLDDKEACVCVVRMSLRRFVIGHVFFAMPWLMLHALSGLELELCFDLFISAT